MGVRLGTLTTNHMVGGLFKLLVSLSSHGRGVVDAHPEKETMIKAVTVVGNGNERGKREVLYGESKMP